MVTTEVGLGMLGKLLKIRGKKKKAQHSEIELTAAALFLKLAAIDGFIDRIERIHLAEIMRRVFRLDDHQINELYETVVAQKLNRKQLEELAAEINQEWGNAKRILLLENLWVLAYANDDLDINENEMIQGMAKLLCLTEQEKFAAQERAEIRLGMHDNF